MEQAIKLEGLKPECLWATHMGAVKGCANYLESPTTTAWLYGACGHAFVINLHGELCPSGPTAWMSGKMLSLMRNIGLRIDCFVAIRDGKSDFEAAQRKALESVGRALKLGIPCYGWELKIPEYYTIHGVDDVGYYYAGCLAEDGEGPKPWNELGATEISVLNVASVEPCDRARDIDTVRGAIEYALEFASPDNPHKFPKYTSGWQAFELWAESLEKGDAVTFGNSYNAAVWAECRAFAVEFLREARARVAGVADAELDNAIEHYSKIGELLGKVRDLHPFKGPQAEGALEKVTCAESAALLREAAVAEREGLEALGTILTAMSVSEQAAG